jgi:hypothetical protein
MAAGRHLLLLLVCAQGAAGCTDQSELWGDGAACAAAAIQTCSESRQLAAVGGRQELCDVRLDEPDDAFADFLRREAPPGTPLGQTFERLEAHGFACGSGEITHPTPHTYHGCRKSVLAGPLVTRTWIASIDIDAAGGVVGYRTNCGMTGP